MEKFTINLYELLKSVSDAQDFMSPHLTNHHQQVAYLSYQLSKKINLDKNDQRDLFIAGLVHDIGALSKTERLELIEEEAMNVNNHAFLGAKLLANFKPLQEPARIIKYHHMPWNYGKGSRYEGEDVPFGSHIIHLADRVCAMVKRDHDILSHIPQIMEKITSKNDSVFEPGLIQALSELSNYEYIWLDLISESPVNKLDLNLSNIVELEIEDMIELSVIFSQIIDFRSSFTAKHSAGVANTAEKLAELVGFSPFECKMMLVAGYLHDIGKLSIDNRVLEKPAKLDRDEYNEIRSHTYYTYQLLHNIPQLRQISEWASYHHERLDGNGYPFHIKGNNLSIGSRIMAIADIFTAITENRPYRDGMNDTEAIQVLNNMVNQGSLDGRVVEIVIHHFQMLNELREQSQQKAQKRYQDFLA